MTEVVFNNKTIRMHANIGSMVKIEQVNKNISSEKEPLLNTVMCIYALILGADPKTDVTVEYIQDNCTPEDWQKLVTAYRDELKQWNDRFNAANASEQNGDAEGNL